MDAMVVEKPGPPEQLRLTKVPDPVPGPDEVLIEVAYAGVGFVDTLFRAGAFPLPLPMVPGIEVSGHVRAVGPGVAGFAPGDRVAALLNDFGRGSRAGGYAELAVAHSSMVGHVPQGVDLSVAAGAVVNGVTRLTGGEGLDVVVDPVGGDVRELAFGHLAPFGRLLVLGNASGEDRRLSADAAWLGSRQVIGLSLGGVAHLMPDRVRAALDSVLGLLGRGVLREPEPAVRPLHQAPEVHRELERRTAPPKTVLRVN